MCIRSTWMLLPLVLLVASCDEPFPVYTPPAQVLQSELQVVSPDTVELFYESMLEQYFLITPTSLKILITNVHDDLLQGPARIDTRIVLQSFAQIPRTMVVQMTRGDLRRPSLFQGNIALGPGASAEFSKLWIPTATDGRLVFEGLPFEQVGATRYYGPITFIAHAEAQVFELVQPIRSPNVQFVLWFSIGG